MSAQPETSATVNRLAPTTEAHQVSIPALTPEQIKMLMSLIDTLKNGHEKLSDKPPWMIDSGASKHMRGDLTLLMNTETISLVVIDLQLETKL